jgi:DNA-binding PadR family transcriptional regulator
MSLKHILLGVLSEPQSGYDIKKHFERSLKNFWRAELSQIYPLLQKMETEGLLKSKADSSDIGPTKRVYERVEKGSAELQAWLGEGPVVGAERVTYLAQVYFLAHLNDTTRSITYMQELRTYMADHLASLEAIEKEWAGADSRYPDELPDAEFYSQLTLLFGLTKLRASVRWCDECIERIKSRQVADAKSA